LAAVTRASATGRAAPLAEFVRPRRSRVAAITGAETGVEQVASNAFKPLTPQYPYPAPCFLCPKVALTARVDVQVGDLVGADQQRRPPGQVHQHPRGHRVELAHVGRT